MSRPPLAEREHMMATLFDPDDLRLPAKPIRSHHLGDPGRRARRDQRALRQGLRLCGICDGRGMSKRAMQRAVGQIQHGRDRAPLFYAYVWLPEGELPKSEGARAVGEAFDGNGHYFEIPWFEVRIACWACLGSGFNCSSEMARAVERRCHTQQRASDDPRKGITA